MMDLLILTGMLFVLMLPILAIPYIFIKLGSVAGRVQGMMNNVGRSARNRAVGGAKEELGARKDAAMARMAAAKWGKDAKGKDLAGRGARFKRGAAKGANFVGGYSDRRQSRLGSIKSDAAHMQQDEIARLLQEPDSKFAKKSTIRGESGEAIARARGIATQDKMIGEEMGAGKVVLDNSGITNAQKQDIATFGYVAKRDAKGKVMHDSAGNAIVDNSDPKFANLQGEFLQKAAQSDFIKTGQVNAVYDMLGNAQNMSEGVRGSMAYHLQQNYSMLKAKDHTLNNDDIKVALTSGNGSVSQQVLQEAAVNQLSGLTKEVFAGTDAAGIKNLESSANLIKTLKASSNPVDVQRGNELEVKYQKALSVASEAYEDLHLKGKYTVASRDATQSLLGITPAAAPAQGATPAPVAQNIQAPAQGAPMPQPVAQPGVPAQQGGVQYAPVQSPIITQPRVNASTQNQIQYTINSSLPTPGGQPLQVKSTPSQIINQVNNVGGWNNVSDADLQRMFKETMREVQGKNPTNDQAQILDMAEKNLQRRGYIEQQGRPSDPDSRWNWTNDPRL